MERMVVRMVVVLMRLIRSVANFWCFFFLVLIPTRLMC